MLKHPPSPGQAARWSALSVLVLLLALTFFTLPPEPARVLAALGFVAALALTLRTDGLRTLLACGVGAAFGLGMSFLIGGVYSREVDPMGGHFAFSPLDFVLLFALPNLALSGAAAGFVTRRLSGDQPWRLAWLPSITTTLILLGATLLVPHDRDGAPLNLTWGAHRATERQRAATEALLAGLPHRTLPVYVDPEGKTFLVEEEGGAAYLVDNPWERGHRDPYSLTRQLYCPTRGGGSRPVAKYRRGAREIFLPRVQTQGEETTVTFPVPVFRVEVRGRSGDPWKVVGRCVKQVTLPEAPGQLRVQLPTEFAPQARMFVFDLATGEAFRSWAQEETP
ncbi:hypothetical protein QOL99_14585 [Deinococcus sp. MIMF12]|uniref:Uncharacterized protein n=1 Tax=Deinococcus rhizophilus TaxID=3049544 RepID=A0ABT7JJX7_9DEIO|nr:hypothetical protein [Deinococcus rhizophilus]MDL2345366.1 hypothetical protein [Deinococcus rhizophilus]